MKRPPKMDYAPIASRRQQRPGRAALVMAFAGLVGIALLVVVILGGSGR